jgi:hypothetical protein
MTDCYFFSCTARASRGGAINANSGNDNLQVTNTTFLGCSAVYGGAIFLGRNKNVRLLNSEFSFTFTRLHGGALYLFGENDGVIVFECDFHRSEALDGGAIYSSALTRGLVIAGCTIENNKAHGDGGGMFVAGGNEHMIITDATTAQYLEIIESEHPYANTGGPASPVIVNETIAVDGATAFVLHFDAACVLNVDDTMTIYDENRNVILALTGGGAWPGIQLAPL